MLAWSYHWPMPKRCLNHWQPNDPAAGVQRWRSVGAGQIAFGPAAADLITALGAGFNVDEVIGRLHVFSKAVNE